MSENEGQIQEVKNSEEGISNEGSLNPVLQSLRQIMREEIAALRTDLEENVKRENASMREEMTASITETFAHISRNRDQEMVTVMSDLKRIRDENKTFREELTCIRKQMEEVSTMGATTFAIRELVEQCNVESDAHPKHVSQPNAQSTPPIHNERGLNHQPNLTAGSSRPPTSTQPSTSTQPLTNNEVPGPSHARSSNAQLNSQSPQTNHPGFLFRQIVMPMEYDGKIPWSRYEIHFSAIARINEWNRDDRVRYLAAYLRGPALTYWETLSTDTKSNYEQASEAFQTRFGPDCQQSVAHIQLRTRVQRNGEHFSEYATELQRLALLTFSDCPGTARDRIALEYFLDGILDLEVQERVRDAAPVTLHQALQTAIRIDANHRATRAARRSIRASVAVTSPDRGRGTTPITDRPAETSTSSGNDNELA